MPAAIHPRRALRASLVRGVAACLALAGAVVAAPVARATTGEVDYSCTTPLGDQMLTATTDTAAGDRTYVGDSAVATSSTALPGRLAQRFRVELGADSVSGSLVVAVAEGTDTRALALTVPRTPLGDQAEARPVPIAASGTYTATTPGEKVLTTGGFAASLVLHRADGSTRPFDLQCRPVTGSATVDTIVVLARTTTALVLDKVSSRYGEAVVATALASSSGASPVGDVAFSIDGVATRTRLAPDGTASWRVPVAPVGTHTLAASFLHADSVFHVSSTSAPAVLTVRKAPTRARASVAGKRTRRPTRVGASIRTAHGTTATGKVRLVLRKVGSEQRWVRNRVLVDGRRTVGLGRLPMGRYRVVVRYAGDRNHMRGPRTVRTFRVRRG